MAFTAFKAVVYNQNSSFGHKSYHTNFQVPSSTPSGSCPYKGQWPLITNLAFTAFEPIGSTIKNLLLAIEVITLIFKSLAQPLLLAAFIKASGL